MNGAAFDIAIANLDPAAFEAAARAVGFPGFGFYPRSGLMHFGLGREGRWRGGLKKAQQERGP